MGSTPISDSSPAPTLDTSQFDRPANTTAERCDAAATPPRHSMWKPMTGGLSRDRSLTDVSSRKSASEAISAMRRLMARGQRVRRWILTSWRNSAWVILPESQSFLTCWYSDPSIAPSPSAS